MKYKRVYHVSPESNLTRLVGRYSDKFKEKGIFVTPSYNDAKKWALFVGSKKSSGYKNVTIYTLKMSQEDFGLCEKIYLAWKTAWQKILTKDDFQNEWDWSSEIFVFNRNDTIPLSIVSKKTFLTSKLIYGKEVDGRGLDDSAR